MARIYAIDCDASMNEPDPIRSLTPAQEEALRLVHRGMTSKEIARALDISIESVDDRIDAARAKLGGVRRAVAARLWFEAQSPPPLFGGTPPPKGGEPGGRLRQQRDVANLGGSMMEQRAVFFTDDAAPLIDRLGGLARSGLIVAFAIGFLIFLGLLKPTIDGIAWIVETTERFFR